MSHEKLSRFHMKFQKPSFQYSYHSVNKQQRTNVRKVKSSSSWDVCQISSNKEELAKEIKRSLSESTISVARQYCKIENHKRKLVTRRFEEVKLHGDSSQRHEVMGEVEKACLKLNISTNEKKENTNENNNKIHLLCSLLKFCCTESQINQNFQVFTLNDVILDSCEKEPSSTFNPNQPRVFQNNLPENSVVDQTIDQILNYAREVVITCREGNRLYDGSNDTPTFTSYPRLSNAPSNKLPEINPKHTKSSWQRTINSHTTRFGSNQQITTFGNFSLLKSEPDDKNIFNIRNKSGNYCSTRYKKQNSVPGSLKNNLVTKSIGDNICSKNSNSKVIPQTLQETMSEQGSTPGGSPLRATHLIEFKENEKFEKHEVALSDCNNNLEDLSSTSEEESLSIGLNKTKTVNKFLNTREFSRKEQEYRQRTVKHESTAWVENVDNSIQSQSEEEVPEINEFASTFSEESFLTTSLTSLDSHPSYALDCDEQDSTSEVHLTNRLTKLFNDLKALWLNVNEMGIVPYINESDNSSGDHKVRLVNLCSFIVKEMSSEWRRYVTSAAEKNKLSQLEASNHLLREQLESASVLQSSLESEMKYLAKEKANLNDEVKALSMQLAQVQGNEKPKQAKKSSSCSSLGFELSPSSSVETVQENNVEKREADFNNLMDVVKSRGIDINYYQAQLEKHYDDVATLQSEINAIETQKSELQSGYTKLSEENQALTKENIHYESILKLILKDKEATGQSLFDLIQVLIKKLDDVKVPEAAKDEKTTSKVALLEGVLQSVQDQNNAYRQEISQLKSILSNASDTCSRDNSELERKYQQLQTKFQERTARLNEVLEQQKRSKELKENLNLKQLEWEDHCKALTFEKDKLEKLVEDKDFEFRKLADVVDRYEKRNLRHEKRIQEMHKQCHRYKREVQDQRQNMEALNTIIHQLRASLKQQKTQWTERVKATNDDSLQAKDHCRWLQTQVEQLNSLLSDALERVKSHEHDKSNLAQQVVANEEERKLVDRKLQELRTALQGDSALREALMERNEALQLEINRLRQAKHSTLDNWKDEGDFLMPPSPSLPSEMNKSDSGPTTHVLHTTCDKGISRKNCYTTALCTSRRPNEVPRSTVSMHASGLKNSQPSTFTSS